ncbi:MAG: hypothetical protein KBA08_05890 [Firmicutes bacterium]|nr:hypothetical protein [Bacillota bacterium]
MENYSFFDIIREELERRACLKGQQEIILIALETKFGNVSDELRERIKSLKEEQTIMQAAREILTAETIKEYMAKLEQLSRA